MKSTSSAWVSFLAGAALLTFSWLQPVAALAAVCQEGTGVPPFLSAGADPNLLLVIDNSGSMLDMAYLESPTDCVDSNYVATTTYAGLFEAGKWYKWTEGVQPWESGKTYSVGEYVYTEGIFYKATAASGDPSVGAEIADDYEVVWAIVHEIDFWTNGTTYSAGSIVGYEKQLYYTAAGGTANDPDGSNGITIAGDTGVTWELVDSTWLSSKNYTTGDIVTDNGILFRATSASIGSRPSEDTTGTDWLRLNEGYFEEVSYTSSADAAVAFASEAGEPYTHSDLFTKIVSVTVDGVVTPSTVSAFAASANFLNWAMSSKFDIQKKILTGGKYDAIEQELISQSRGCAEHNSFKEVPVIDSGGVASVLTMAVNGPSDGDFIDTLDRTTRLTVLAVSDGFDSSAQAAACNSAITMVSDGLDTNEQGTFKNLVKTCLDYGDVNNIMAESNSAYNHSMHECWFAVKSDYTSWTQLGSMTDVEASCEHIYRLDMPPATITPDNSGYVCYGVYSHDGTDPDPTPDHLRPGYVGRCWEPSTIPSGCQPVPCAVGTEYDTGNPRCFPDDYMYNCSGNFNEQQDSCNKTWVLQLVDDGSGTCDPTDAASVTPADWTDDANLSATVDDCVKQAVWDYCQGLSLVEVIDPTDQLFNSGDTWGVPGALIDSGVYAALGTNRSLLTMKGFIKKTTKPEGVLHQVAEDLRIGAMAFHQNGAATECLPAYLESDGTIVKYCPDENRDGAQVVSPIQSGVATDANGNLHVENLAAAINDIRATAWTPLAEAVYTALGYYGQKGGVVTDATPGYKLSDEDYKTELEDASWADPVQYWCQENYLLIITEGASTTDINPTVLSMLKTMGYEDGTVLLDDETECFADDGVSHSLYGSTYLDDLTYFGQHASVDDLYQTSALNPGQLQNNDGEWHDKQNITTYIVSTGMLRDDGTTSECNPATIITNAAANGGTTLLKGENPDDLDDNLTQVLSDILSRASAGSAASVISSSRSGSGAVYQAIFWPELVDDNDNKVEWVGDVHALFMSSGGLMYEDTDGDGKLNPMEDLNNDGDVGDLDLYGRPEDINDNSTEDGGDKRVIFFYSENGNKTRGCYNVTDYLLSELSCPTDLTDACLYNANPEKEGFYCENDPTTLCNSTGVFTCPDDPVIGSCQPGDDCVEIQDIGYLWSASKKLRDLDPDDRKIFTWNDASNDGIVDADEWFELDYSVPWATLNATAQSAALTRGPVTEDFLTPSDWLTFVDNDQDSDATLENDALTAFIQWIRGTDQLNDEIADGNALTNEDVNSNGRLDKKLRSRQFRMGGITKEWRLGDVIHSTPIVVAKPAEAYQYIYRDPSYGYFSKKWDKRRNMIYFGANDGMLHAVNGGFYFEHLNQFCCTAELDPATGLCVDPMSSGSCSGGEPDLGKEMWAYVPYNLQPHLKCLANPEYDHKYYVDQKPRIFDAQIFEEESYCKDAALGYTHPSCIHAGGWGTILVGSMRFGGAPVDAADLNGDTDDKREFTSSFFILDVTDPESDPVLLGEMTRTTENEGTEDKYVDLNYTTASPTMVVMRNKDGLGVVKTDWYLVMGNGPTALNGENDNDEQGRIAVLPLEWLNGKLTTWGSDGIPEKSVANGANVRGFRIPNKRPDGGDYSIDPTKSGEGGVFLIPRTAASEPSYVSDLITVDFDVENDASGGTGSFYKSDAVYFGTTDGTGFEHYPDNDSDQTYWDGGGRLFRLVTKVLSGGEEVRSKPSEWDDQWGDNDPLRMLVDAKAPITAAPSVGYDGNSFWVYAGTGRFFDKKDKTDDGQYDSTTIDLRSKVSFFGIREPVDVSTNSCYDNILSWETINWDINSLSNSSLNHNGTPGSRGLMQTDNIMVAEEDTSKYLNISYLECLHCVDNELDPYDPICSSTYPSGDALDCFPNGLPQNTIVVYRDNDEKTANITLTTFDALQDYIAGTGCLDSNTSSGVDGWYRDFHEARERNLGQSALLGGLLTYTGYRPYNDVCQAEGVSYLYGVHYQTGTAWTESVFGTFARNGERFVMDKLSLGRGLATTPSMHVGTGDGGATAFVQTSTGEIIEVKQENLPIDNVKSGRSSWSDRCSP